MEPAPSSSWNDRTSQLLHSMRKAKKFLSDNVEELQAQRAAKSPLRLINLSPALHVTPKTSHVSLDKLRVESDQWRMKFEAAERELKTVKEEVNIVKQEKLLFSSESQKM